MLLHLEKASKHHGEMILVSVMPKYTLEYGIYDGPDTTLFTHVLMYQETYIHRMLRFNIVLVHKLSSIVMNHFGWVKGITPGP